MVHNFRCRVADQYCCGHSCCYQADGDDSPHLFASWYFWSLILVVLVVFGCIIVSFALSSLKSKSDIESWSSFAGNAFNNLGETQAERVTATVWQSILADLCDKSQF